MSLSEFSVRFYGLASQRQGGNAWHLSDVIAIFDDSSTELFFNQVKN